jgi:hypothetical protein
MKKLEKSTDLIVYDHFKKYSEGIIIEPKKSENFRIQKLGTLLSCSVLSTGSTEFRSSFEVLFFEILHSSYFEFFLTVSQIFSLCSSTLFELLHNESFVKQVKQKPEHGNDGVKLLNHQNRQKSSSS